MLNQEDIHQSKIHEAAFRSYIRAGELVGG